MVTGRRHYPFNPKDHNVAWNNPSVIIRLDSRIKYGTGSKSMVFLSLSGSTGQSRLIDSPVKPWNDKGMGLPIKVEGRQVGE
jgi:hypothetical protein